MRFEALRLVRYGAFEQRDLSFEHPGLTVIFGPNEAGKSTSLAAVGDFLFGVPTQTSRGAVFGYDAMRIEAGIACADGRKLNLRRRKGRAGTRTLSDDAGATFDDGVMLTLLGPTDRDRFEVLFGLDHERLRRGGQQILQSNGEIGRLIVEAGGGLASLVRRLEAIDAQIEKLFMPRRSADRAFYKALDAFDAADREVKASLVTREIYQKAMAAHLEAIDQVEGLRKARRGLAVQRGGTERLVRVIPLLQRRAALVAQLEEYSDLAHVDDGFAKAAEDALEARNSAATALDLAQTALDLSTRRLLALVVDDRLIAAETDIRKLSEAWPHVTQTREDRPNRLREFDDAQSKLGRLRQLTGISQDADLAAMLPTPDAIATVRKLALQARDLEHGQRDTSRRIGEISGEMEALQAGLSEADAELLDRRIGVSASEIAALPSDAASAKVLTDEATALRTEVERLVAALGFSDVAAIKAAVFPDAEALGRLIAKVDAAAERRIRQVEAVADAERRRDRAIGEIARLQSAEIVATDEAVRAAREARQSQWRPIRRVLSTGEMPPNDQARFAMVDAMENAVSEADSIADRRSRDADRAASLAQQERQRREAEYDMAVARRAVDALAEEAKEALDQFARTYPSAAVKDGNWIAIKARCDRMRDASTGLEKAEKAMRAVEAAKASLAPAMDALRHAEQTCGLAPPAGAAVRDRVRDAMSAIGAHEAKVNDFKTRKRRLADLKVLLKVAKTEAGSIEQDRAKWTAAWRPALERIHVPADMAPDDAAEVAHEWGGAIGVSEALTLTMRRLAGMDERERSLSALVTEIASGCEIAVSDDAVVGARMLWDRFDANEKARQTRDALQPSHLQNVASVERLSASLDDAAAALAAVEAQAGVESEGDLRGMIDRIRARAAAVGEQRALELSVATAGDGMAVADLENEALGRDLADLSATVDDLMRRETELESQLDEAIRLEHSAKSALAAYQSEETAGAFVAQRESATANLHDVVERYVELAVARDLLSEAISRVRADRQDPLIVRAGALFSQMTRGRYSGVAADLDFKGEPAIVGVLADGGHVTAATMSDGTRDQLYLAFRLASVETYCRSAEPLPFIADDVLVHFDDDRASAALDFLAEFGASTQVLLFTHHQSVRDKAKAIHGAGLCGLVDI